MDDRHLRAVIRAALRANGFDVRIGELAAADRRARALGLRLRDLLLDNLPGFAPRADIVRMADEDPYLWNRLPGMLAFGHQQAVVFGRVINPCRRALPAASLLPVSAFSAGISLLDYLADALWFADQIFEVIDEATVASLFRSGPEAEARLRAGYQHAGDVRLRLLFALVGVCGAGVRGQHHRHRDDGAWADLVATFARLHAAQKAVTFHHVRPLSGPGCTDAVSVKSVLPFVAAYQMAELYDPPGAVKQAGRELALRIGQAVAVTDDLVDLLTDWWSGTPNTIIGWARADDRGPDGGPSDAWLYRVAGQAAERVASTVNSIDDEAAARFAMLTVARWTRWREELSPPSVFAVRRPRPGPAGPGPLADAVAMLLFQQATGYEEAVHWMTVPRIQGDRVRLQACPAVLFQRAVVLDSLLDAYAAGMDVPASVLAREALTLLREKRTDVRGGWSYLPDVPELPPDVNDLAMVAQALLRCGGQPLAAAGERALNLVLDTADRGETVTTWILDPDDAPQRNDLFRRFIELTQAGGVQPEVVANLLYAVSLQATDATRRRAGSMIAFLESAQDDDGSWHSRWSSGVCYGTYRAVLALASVAPDSHALTRARDYLVSGQHADGGWGADGVSDPLATALAALALAALPQPEAGRPGNGRPGTGRPGNGRPGNGRPDTGRRLGRAVEYLLGAQQADGGWPGCPFIAFPRVDGPGAHVYRSSTITTSFCLKAILAVRGAHPVGRPGKARPSGRVMPRGSSEWATAADWS